MHRKAFSLIEVLLAVFILGIGAIGIAALFPAGIAQQRSSTDDVIGPLIADNAIALLRARLSQDDFGSFEDFGIDPSFFPPEMVGHAWPTVAGDWPWLRPGFILGDDSATQTAAGNPYDERGAIDIFSYRYTRQMEGFSEVGSLLKATEFPGGFVTATTPIYGIPYNLEKHTFFPANFTEFREPRFIVTQQERYYPMVTGERPPGDPARPRYVWDCMFRRFRGTIFVAIFVYRVNLPSGGDTSYVVPPNPLLLGAPNPVDTRLPPLPYRLDLTARQTLPNNAWDAFGIDVADPADDAQIVGTPGGVVFNPLDPEQSWQQERQWLLDQNNNMHRVLSSARRGTGDPATEDLIVELLRPLSAQPRSNLYWYGGASAPELFGLENVVTHLWYIPAEVELDVDGDGNLDEGATVSLTPVYITVREL